jgi:hypothetical protein
MRQLAYGNDATVHANINNAKATLGAMYARCSAQHHHQISTAHRAARRRRVPHQVPQSPSQLISHLRLPPPPAQQNAPA